jgi:hypothetical protein
MKEMKDGLYLVDTKNVTAAFVIRHGEVTTCAPILRSKIEYWKGVAKWIPTDQSMPPVTEPVEAVI